MEIIKQISNIGIVPVIKIKDISKAVPLAKALIDGGLPVAEVTFRAANADKAIKAMAEAYPEMIVGAGTVLTIEQAALAKECGAKFIVAPGFNPKVVKWCIDNDILVTPGISTPSEIEQAIEMGLKTVKFFPAEQSGGIAKIKAMAAPYGDITFMPTGGIGLDNMNDYLSFKKIVACGGSFMVKEDLIDNCEWDKITELTKKSVEKMLDFKVAHLGINNENEEQAIKTAKMLSLITGMPFTKESAKGIFVGTDFEVMKSKGPGTNGHIGIKTNNVDRAVYHLSKKGIEFDETTATYNDDGSRKFIYVKDEIAGFMLHIVQA